MQNFVAYRVNIVANAIFRSTSRYFLEELDLRTPEVWVMTAIGNFQPMSASEVSENMSIDKAQVSRALTSLMERGYVVRVPDPGDNRRKMLRLTNDGVDIYQRILEISETRQNRLLSSFSESEQAQLMGFLDRLRDNAEHLSEMLD
ncbi:MAG: MarR family transcriptional regulator [Rhodospirillales bacterium]|nr:MarR family transcriptional regulator [Rhodospirillales bacterium]